MTVYSSFLWNSSKLEKKTPDFFQRVNKQTGIFIPWNATKQYKGRKKTLKTGLTYDPSIPVLGIYVYNKTIIQKMCSWQHYSQYPGHKQPKCPSTDEWIKKMWYINTMEDYSAILSIRKNEMMPFAETWMDLEIITLNEVNQKEKYKYHMISLTCGI